MSSSTVGNKPTSRHSSITDDALQSFIPGQKISLKPLSGCTEVSFTICKLFTPITRSVVVLAKPDLGDSSEHVVIKIYDPRYLELRIAKEAPPGVYLWNLANEQAAAIARSQNAKLSIEELRHICLSHRPDGLSGKELSASYLLWEEYFYRVMMDSYETELTAYERLKDLQGSAIPRFIMVGQALPLEERAIQLPAIVLEYVPSINLYDISSNMVSPPICVQLLSAIETFPSYGVIHDDLSFTNIKLTPPEWPVRAVVFDFGSALLRCEDEDEEIWMGAGACNVRWARSLLEDKLLRNPKRRA